MIGVFFVFAVIATLIVQTIRNSNKRSCEELPAIIENHPESVSNEGIDVAKPDTIDYSAYTENYNYQRAMELLGQDEEEEAFKYLKKALDDDGSNGYAHAWIARIFLRHENFGTALKAVNTAMSCLSESNQAWLYVIRARIYKGLEDFDLWKKDAEEALSLDPAETDAMEELSEYYFINNQYDESDRQISKFIELEPHNPYGYMVKGRNEMMRKHFEEALSLFEYAERLDTKYVAAPSFKAEMLIELNRFSDAISSVITALELMFESGEQNQKTIYVRNLLAKKSCDLFELKLKSKVTEGENKTAWLGTLGVVLSIAGRYVESAQYYRELYLITHDSCDLSYEAYCWRKVGNFKKSSLLLEKAVVEDPENFGYKENLLMLKGDLGLFEEAIKIGNDMVSLRPDNVMAYYNRGRMYQMSGNHKDAIKDFDTVLVLTENNNAFALFYRGISNLILNQKEFANKDFSTIIDSKKLVGRNQFLALAVLFKDGAEALNWLADTDGSEIKSVIQIMNEYVDHEVKNVNDNNDDPKVAIEAYMLRAALRCRINLVSDALSDVKNALELGANRFYYYRHSYLLSPLHQNETYDQLMSDYEEKVISSWGEANVVDGQESFEDIVEPKMNAFIPFSKEGAMCKVKCTINDLPLYFVFDTGASDVSMSTVEATFMLKNGYLKQQDLSGNELYMTASGEIAEGTRVRIREVDFGGLKLTNVKASIVKSQNAPLLLGQSVLQQLGKIEIDNENNVIKVIR